MPPDQLPPTDDYLEFEVEDADNAGSEESAPPVPAQEGLLETLDLMDSPEDVLSGSPKHTSARALEAKKRIAEIDISLRILADKLRRIGSKKTTDAEQERTRLTKERINLEGERGKLWRVVSPVEKSPKK